MKPGFRLVCGRWLEQPATAQSPEQVRARFRNAGLLFTDWAKAHGFPRHLVYLVLNGSSKARFGKGHQIAVLLGLKSRTAA